MCFTANYGAEYYETGRGNDLEAFEQSRIEKTSLDSRLDRNPRKSPVDLLIASFPMNLYLVGALEAKNRCPFLGSLTALCHQSVERPPRTATFAAMALPLFPRLAPAGQPLLLASRGVAARAAPDAPACRAAFHASAPAASNVGKRLISLPPEVSVEIKDLDEVVPFTKSRRHAVVSGPKGSLKLPLHPFIALETTAVEGTNIRRLKVLCDGADKRKFNRSMWGTTNALLTNMVEGVSDGVSVIVRLVGVGYRATMVEGGLDLKLGYSHQILLPIPKSVTVTAQNPQRLKISGIDWHEVTKFASQIREWRPPEP